MLRGLARNGGRESRRRRPRAMLGAVRFAVAIAFAVAVIVVACGNNPRNLLTMHYDGGADGDVEGGPFDAAGDADPYLGGPCVDDAQCDDGIKCTFDSCDKALMRCRNVPDDTQCDDGIYCDGKELCVPHHGCEAGPVVSCDDGNPCHLAKCVEATKSCQYTPRDVDQDGDPDSHCVPMHDCNDLNPNVSSLHSEVCSNGIDDNCNGVIDEHPCVAAPGDTCATAVAVGGAGSYALSTKGCDKNFATSCSVTNPQGGRQVVAAITVPNGPNVDLEVWATTMGVEVAVAIDGVCGSAASELGCGSGPGASSVRARARNVAPGTYFAVVTTQTESDVVLEVNLLTPTPKPTNVDCATAQPEATGTPFTVQIVDPPSILPSACTANTGALTYSFTLAQPQDVRVYASTLVGSGSPVVGLRDPACSGANDELFCRVGSTTPLYAEDLQPGTYVLTVAATSPIDESVTIDLYPPTTPPADQTCAAPPPASVNQTVPFDLSNHEDAIKDNCFPGGPDAAFDLSLAVASDVLVVGRFPQTEEGAVALDEPACDKSSVLACQPLYTPARAGKRNVAPGDYRVVVSDQFGLQGTLTTLVRPTVAPSIIPPGGGDTCANAVDASSGGFFTGDTSKGKAHYDEPCDAPNEPPGGAPDQVLTLNLAQAQRVVLDMEGSTYTTILAVYQGPSCPGTLVQNACYVGFAAPKSFLDLELGAGQYWIIVDGYALGKGAWNLDVRVLPP
jgi:hypothetical protein